MLLSFTLALALLHAAPEAKDPLKGCTVLSEGSHRAEVNCPDRAVAYVELGPPWSSPIEFLELFARRGGQGPVPHELTIGVTKRPGFIVEKSHGRQTLFVAPDPTRPLAIQCFKTVKMPVESVCTDVIEAASKLDLRALEPKSEPVIVFTKKMSGGQLVGSAYAEAQLPPALARGAAPANYAHLLEDQRLTEPVEVGDPVLLSHVGWEKLLTPLPSNACIPPDQKSSLRAEAANPPKARGGTRTLLVAATYLKAGEALSRATLTITEVPANKVSRSFVGIEAIDLVVGQKVMLPISAGEPLRFSALAGFPGARNHCQPAPAKK